MESSSREALQTALPKTKLTNCTAMLLRTRKLDATDPRDKIFAIHGLLLVLGACLPNPDYSKSTEQVYREAAAAAIAHDARLHILGSITGESLIKDLPSWVPDWSCNQPISEIASWDDYVVLSEPETMLRISVIDGSRLTLGGVEVDTIQEHSVAFPDRYHDNRISLKRFEENSDTLPNARYSASDIGYWAGKCAQEDGLTLGGEYIGGDVRFFHKLMRSLLDRKVMFRTERGYLGIASRALQISDRIVYFQGASVPMLIRKVESNWRLVAPAYIQDVSSDKARTGSCLSKKVTFKTTGPDINCAVCHCTNCRRNNGSTYTVKAWFPDKRFKFTSGEDLLKQHDDSDTNTGGIVNRISIVHVGLFDEAWDWRIDFEQWRKSRMSFVEDIPGVSDDCRYYDFPDKREFERVMAKL
ncbi:heterokaryon incompatibility protein [Paraphaeosphaeria sporulosa]